MSNPRRLVPWLVLTLLTAPCTAAEPAFVIKRPTILAFFPPMSDADMERDPDGNEALSDFQFYAARVREPLARMGIDFRQVYARSFRITHAGKTRTFRPGPIQIGYYFAAPGRAPRIEYGVDTDIGLLEKARQYFRSPPK